MEKIKFNEITVVETAKIESEKPVITVGLPDVGLVGPIATSHIVQALNMKEVGYFESDLFPPMIIVHKNEPKPQVRIFAKDNLVVVLSETVFPVQAIYQLSKAITLWAKRHNAKFVVGVTGIATPNRLEIEKPSVYGFGSTVEAKNELEKLKVQPFEEGILVGIYALLVKDCINEQQPNITLLTESHMQFPDPGAAASTVEVLNSLFGVNINVKSLLEKEEEIRIKARELMRKTSEQMKALRKVQEQELRGIYV
ncbi:MAG: proteasome assembly chaperone family protein [Candidatus Bathyarchaeota archaeon]